MASLLTACSLQRAADLRHVVAYGRFAATCSVTPATSSTSARDCTRRWPSTVWRRQARVSQRWQNPGVERAEDMRLQRMLGHLTTSCRRIRVGDRHRLWRGRDRRRGRINPRVERVTIVEIEPLVPKVAAKYFSVEPRRRPESEGAYPHDDARHYLMTTKEKFDAITSDPLNPWVKGAATLYTKEFFRRHATSQAGWRDDAVRAVVREHAGGGEERNRNVLRGLPERPHRRQHLRRSATIPCCWGRSIRRASISMRSRHASSGPTLRRWPRRCGRSVSPRRSICSPPMPAGRSFRAVAPRRVHQQGSRSPAA